MSINPLTSAPVAAKVVGKAAGPLSAASVLEEIVKLTREWIQVDEEETTKRAQIEADAKLNIAEIHARRDLFLTYLDKTFDEREKNFEELFARLDEALANDSEAVGLILSSISTLALKSPFADLHDPVALRQKLDDPTVEWEV
jgi:hypothetical protein